MGARRITAVIHLGAAGLAMLLAGSRPSWGQGQAEDFAAAPAVPAAMHQLFDMPRAQLGTTRGQLQRALGQAGRISAREVANVYESGVVDRIWTLVFDGATAEVYEARAMGREYLLRVRLETRRIRLRGPVSLGDARGAVLARLGAPSRVGADVLEYEVEEEGAGGADRVVLHLKRDRVVSIEWAFAID